MCKCSHGFRKQPLRFPKHQTEIKNTLLHSFMFLFLLILYLSLNLFYAQSIKLNNQLIYSLKCVYYIIIWLTRTISHSSLPSIHTNLLSTSNLLFTLSPPPIHTYFDHIRIKTKLLEHGNSPFKVMHLSQPTSFPPI